jgi:hypothetical protein
MTTRTRHILLGLACTLALVPLRAAANPSASPTSEAKQYTGKVVPLADLLAKQGIKLDADARPYWLALVTDEGKIYPLIKDGGARLFFLDKALWNRPMRLTGQLLPGSQLLRVQIAHSLKNGKLYEIYYWCDVCSIRRGEKMPSCECCGGPMVLHEDPIK